MAGECAGKTTIEMSACAQADFLKSDAELNSLYKQVIAKAEALDKEQPDHMGWPGFKDSIVNAQRAWVVFRDKECELQTLDAEGGSLRQIEYPSCKKDMTDVRVNELEKLIKDVLN